LKINTHLLNTWKQDSHFYPSAEILLSIKSFDLAAIRKRYLASRKNLSGTGGSVERRAVSLGGLAKLTIGSGHLKTSLLIPNLKEPRGLSSASDRLAFSLENEVIILDENGLHSFSDPWFSYIHTVAFHPHKKETVLVSSSGFDALFEFHYPTGTKTWEWFAWENGLNKAKNASGESIYLTRKAEQRQEWLNEGIEHLYIANPKTDHLPTAQRAAFINTASYDPNGEILATLFHEGTVRQINHVTGESTIVVRGLKNPHGGYRSISHIMVTNTGKGELWLEAQNGDQDHFISEGLSGKAPEMGDANWWQNAIAWGQNYIVIDSNRNALLILDPVAKLFDLLSFNADWAVQDLILLSGSEPSFEAALKSFQKSNNPTN
jgi:hypothetical protein